MDDYDAMTLVELLDLLEREEARPGPKGPEYVGLLNAVALRLPPLGGLVEHRGKHYVVGSEHGAVSVRTAELLRPHDDAEQLDRLPGAAALRHAAGGSLEQPRDDPGRIR